jgi:sterol 3beta-glucosyltransferase/vancomycin aglycone glucosyltransferase
MRIGIQTWGSEGDVRPLLALAGGLSAAGHQVTVAITHIENREYSALGSRLGVATRAVGHLDPSVLHATGRKLIGRTNPLAQLRIIARDLFDPLVDAMLDAAQALCRENDLVVGHFLVHPLQAAAERAGVPQVSVFLAPLIPSGEMPVPGLPELGRVLNGLVWRIGGLLMDLLFKPPIAAVRRRLGLTAPRSLLRDVYLSREMNLVGVSPALFPPPGDWPGHVHLCGAFQLPEGGSPGTVPGDLQRFLDNGPPPVYLTFGSMFVADPQAAETVKLLSDAVRVAGCRGIVQCPPELAAGGMTGDDLFFVGPAPHDRIFPRSAAVVHHGGSGTTQAVSRAGVPSVIVPHATDQVFWGGLLYRRGLAPRPMDRRTVTVSTLARAIRTVLDSRSMQERAREIGGAMGRENGVASAVSYIEEHFGAHT